MVKNRDELVSTIRKMEEAKGNADEILKHIPEEGMWIWIENPPLTYCLLSIMQIMPGSSASYRSKKKMPGNKRN